MAPPMTGEPPQGNMFGNALSMLGPMLLAHGLNMPGLAMMGPAMMRMRQQGRQQAWERQQAQQEAAQEAERAAEWQSMLGPGGAYAGLPEPQRAALQFMGHEQGAPYLAKWAAPPEPKRQNLPSGMMYDASGNPIPVPGYEAMQGRLAAIRRAPEPPKPDTSILQAMFERPPSAPAAPQPAAAGAPVPKTERPLLPIEEEIGYRLSPTEKAVGRQAAAMGDIEGLRKHLSAVQKRRFDQANALRDEYRQLTTAPNQVIQTANRATELLAPGRDTPMDDVEALYTFIKALDPTSVVREGEVGLAARAEGLMQRLERTFEQAVEGGLLTDEMKRMMLTSVHELGEIAKKTRDAYASEYTGLADRSYVNPQDVIVNPYELSDLPPQRKPGETLEEFKKRWKDLE